MNAARAGFIPVWGAGLRLAHAALAGCVLGCLVLHEGGRWHEALGYAALALALARLAWGLAGRRVAGRGAFAAFVHGPAATWAHARQVWARREPRHVGHNPLGGWMIVLLLATAALAGASGAAYATDRWWGDEVVYAVHRLSGWAFAAWVPLHLAGVAWSSWRQRENLAAAMVHGRKRPAGPGDVD